MKRLRHISLLLVISLLLPNPALAEGIVLNGTSGLTMTGTSGITLNGNWNTATNATITPGASTVTFNAVTGTKTIALTGEDFNNVTFNDGGGNTTFQFTDPFDANGNVTITGGTVDANVQNMTVGGNWTNSDIFTSGANTVTFDGATAQTINAGGTANNDKDFNNVVVSGSTLQLTGTALEIDGTLTVNATKTIDLNGQNVNVLTQLTNNGTFQLQGNETFSIAAMNNNAGEVKFDGTANLTIPAFPADFYDLTFDEEGTSDPTFTLNDANLVINNTLKVTDGTVAFDDDKNVQVSNAAAAANAVTVAAGGILSNAGTGDLTLGGPVSNAGAITFNSSDDAGDAVLIRSTTNGTQRNWQGAGTFSMTDVNVRDQTAIGGTPAGITTTSATNSGNNVNWFFGGALTLSGTAYTDKSEATTLNNKALRILHWNGSVATSYTATTSGAGVFTFSMLGLTSGDPLIVYLDDEAEEGNLVYITDGNAAANLKIYGGAVAMRNDTGAGITNANLASVDGGDDDIKYAIAAGNATFEDAFEVFIFSGATYAPGGTVTGGSYDINGTFNAAANAVTVRGNWDGTGGTLTSTGTVTFTGTGATTTITAGSADFNHLTFNDAGANSIFTLQDTLDVNGNLTITGGSVNANGQNIELAGNWSNADIFTSGAGIVIFDGGAAQTIDSGGIGNDKDFQNITVSGSSVALINNAIEIDGTLLINATKSFDLDGRAITLGTLSNSGTFQLQGAETVTVTTMDDDSGTVLVDGTANATIPGFNGSVFSLTFDESGAADPTYTLADVNMTINGVLTVTDGTLAFDNDKNVLLDNDGAAANPLVVAAAGTFTNTGTGDLTLGGTVANAGTITFNSSDDAGDGITITTDDGSTQRNWTGAGAFNMTDVTASYQTATVTPPFIYVVSGTNGGNNNNWLFAGGALTAASITLPATTAGAEGDVTVAFTLQNALPADGKIVINFDDNFNAQGLTTITNVSNVDGTWTVALSNGGGTNDIVTLTRGGAATMIAAGTAISIRLEDEVRNPQLSGTFADYAVQTQIASGGTIDTALIAGPTLTAGVLTSTSVIPASLEKNDEGNVVISFTAVNPVPADGKIVITFPTSLGGGFTFNAGGATAAAINAGFDGTLAVTIAANEVTVTRAAGTPSAAGAKQITLSNVKNPNAIGSTGTFEIVTRTAANVDIDEDTAVAAVTITPENTASMTELLDSTGAAATEYTVSSSTTGKIYVRVTDTDENENDLVIDDITFVLSSAQTGDAETITLTETGLATGIFDNLSTGVSYDVDDAKISGNGILESRPGAAITATYTDKDLGTDVTTAVATIRADEGLILMTLTVEPDSASIGDLVTYTSIIENQTNQTLTGFDIVVQLPPGFVYRADSGKVDTGTYTDDTIGQQTRFTELSDITSATKRTLQFQAILGAGVEPGSYPTSIYAQINPIISNTANITILVKPDAVFHIGTLIGKVFWDVNRNGVQDRGEIGIPNAVVATEQGYVMTTDQYGRYHIPDFLSGRHMIKVDRASMPVGTQLTTPEAVVVNQTDAMLTKTNFGVIIPDEAAHLYDIERQADVNILLEKDAEAPVKSLDLEFYTIRPEDDKNRLEEIRGDTYASLLYDTNPVLPFRINMNYAKFITEWEFEVAKYEEEASGVFGQETTRTAETVAIAKEKGSPETATLRYPWTHPLVDEATNTMNRYQVRLKVKDAQGKEDSVVYDLDARTGDEGEILWKLTERFREDRIPMKGTTVKIKGETHANQIVSVFGKEMLTTGKGEFTYSVILPAGEHQVPILLYEALHEPPKEVIRHIDLRDTYLFFVGFSEYETGQLDIKGAMQSVTTEDKARFTDTFYDESRVAYYLKGKIKGKYLITASVDTEREQRELYRHIEPEEYYAVYGDGSSVQADANDTQDKYYFLLQVDKSSLKYGNFDTDFKGTEFADFERTLHGVKLDYQSLAETPGGNAQTVAKVFHATARQRAAHNEFRATGGSLYYLKHKDMIRGSEQVRVIIRDKDTQIPLYERTLLKGQDYSIDYEDGRIRLYRPVTAFSFESSSILSIDPLPGHWQYLVVDYSYESKEYVKDINAGARVSQSIYGDWLRLGGTYVQEERALQRYELQGIDAVSQLPLDTLVHIEHANSTFQSTGAFMSQDGGLTFDEVELPDTAEGSQAGAFKWDVTSRPWTGAEISAYLREVDPEFSSSETLTETGSRKYGYGFSQNVGQWGNFTYTHVFNSVKGGLVEELKELAPEEGTIDRASYEFIQGKWDATAEYYQADETDGSERLAGAEAGYQLTPKTRVAMMAQADLEQQENNQLRMTLEHAINQATVLKAIHTYGPEGSGSLIGIDGGIFGEDRKFKKAFGSLKEEEEEEKKDLSQIGSDKDLSHDLVMSRRVDKNTDMEVLQNVGDDGMGKRVVKVVRNTADGRIVELVQQTDGEEEISSYSEATPVSPQVTKYTQVASKRNTATEENTTTRTSGYQAKVLDGRATLYQEQEEVLDGDLSHKGNRMGGEWQVSEHGLMDFSYEKTSNRDEMDNLAEHHAGKLEYDYYDFERLKLHNEWEFLWNDDTQDTAQLLSEGEAELNLTPEWTLVGRYDWSWTKDFTNIKELARLQEFQTGAAYRPTEVDWFNMLFEYKFISDEAPEDQIDLDNQTLNSRHVLRGEFIFDLTPRIQWVEKLAVRDNKTIIEESDPLSSRTYLNAHRLNYRLTERMTLSGEYRVMTQSFAQDSTLGYLMEASYRFTDSLRVGVGYSRADYESKVASDLNVRTTGWYVRIFYDAIEEIRGAVERRQDNTQEVAKKLEQELAIISQTPGKEKDIQQIQSRLQYARELMDKALYEEAIDVLNQGMELYQTARLYTDRAKEKQDQFAFYLGQGKLFYEHELYTRAFEYFQKAYDINAFDEELLKLMSDTRRQIQEVHKVQKQIQQDQRAALQKIKAVQDPQEVLLQSVRMHYHFGSRYADLGMYEEAMKELERGLNLAKQVSPEVASGTASHPSSMEKLRTAYEAAQKHYDAGEFDKAKEELKNAMREFRAE